MDWFDQLSTSWVKTNPEEDYSLLPPLVRLGRISGLLEKFQKEVTQPFGVSVSEYNVLATLRRSGKPFRLTPSELCSILEFSSGGMTKMLRKLEDMDLIARIPDEDDGRSSLVKMTAKGQKTEREIFDSWLVYSRRLLRDIEPTELDEINQSLEKLLGCFQSYFYR